VTKSLLILGLFQFGVGNGVESFNRDAKNAKFNTTIRQINCMQKPVDTILKDDLITMFNFK
jgi:hypothetical protein